MNKDELFKVLHTLRQTVAPSEESYPDARWQREEYGRNMYNKASSDVEQFIKAFRP